MRRAIVIAATGILLSAAAGNTASAERLVALVIGNSEYTNASKLLNPLNDATAVSVMLESAGFKVELHNDLSITAMRRTIRDFSDQAREADVAVVYYAGHGIQVDGTNFLIPTDAKLERDMDVEDEAIALERVMKVIEPARRLRLVILDACRDDPFTRSMKRTMPTRAIGRGLAKVDPTVPNTLIAFSAKAGSTASDGDGSNSPFTAALVKHIAVPDLDLRIAFGNVSDEVLKNTGNRQEPVTYSSLGGGTIALVRTPKDHDEQAATSAPPATTTANAAYRDYELAMQAGTIEVWDSFLREHPDGFYANLGRAQRARLLAAVPPPPAAPPAVPAIAPAPAVAAVPSATTSRSLTPAEPDDNHASAHHRHDRERARENAHAKEHEHRTARHGRGGGLCGHVRTAVRIGTRAGLDNGVGLIAAGRAYCGG